MLATAQFRDPLPLSNRVQRYDWGSVDAIPGFVGKEPDGGPQAELWLGAHTSAPSTVRLPDVNVSLDELVRSLPEDALGHRVAERFGPRLPYLLKVLAAGRALSLQVHPSSSRARDGFERENNEGVPFGPKRSFRDDQHKPEMLLALTQFEGLAGFRNPRTILELLDGLSGTLVDGVRGILMRDRSHAGMRAAFQLLLSGRLEPSCAADIDATLVVVRERLRAGSPFSRADRTVADLADQHPGDPGAIASLMLNRISLEPGEAIFTPAGEVHAYLSGLGVEIMANSDNVLRAGLTSKHVDEAALMACASFVPRRPASPEVTTSGSRGQVHTYRVPVAEFALTTADVDLSEAVTMPPAGPRIVLGLSGRVELATERSDGGRVTLQRGESAFVPHGAGGLQVAGSGYVLCAWVPDPG
ncbi:mannose-6-phosphate isomerase, class I [Georgenia halophila]|uniref:mannose-6-phosphate isomerase n=1 Tax=Georgenia halophila TaxID=620889 RepID=A0ABP8L2U9_9MICO